MPLKTLGELFGTAEALKALKVRVRRASELQSLYVRTAPRELAGSSRVKGCRAGTLFVFADNAAVAAKLKQLAPRLVAAIRENEPEINQIRIEVQVGGREAVSGSKSRKKPLTEGAVRRLDELAETMPEGGLKAALARLAARHKRALNQDQALEHVKHQGDDHHDERELDDAPGPGEVAPVAGVEVKTHRKPHGEQA